MKTNVMTIKQFLAERERFKCKGGKCFCRLRQNVTVESLDLCEVNWKNYKRYKEAAILSNVQLNKEE